MFYLHMWKKNYTFEPFFTLHNYGYTDFDIGGVWFD